MPSHLLTTDFLCTLTLVSYTDFVNKVKKNTIIIHLSTTFIMLILLLLSCVVWSFATALVVLAFQAFFFSFFNLFVPFDF